MHKLIHLATLATLAAATSLAPSSARAVDYKSISPSLCRPLTGPDAAGLVFDSRGVVNSTSVNKRVICSILKDADAAYSPTYGAYVFVALKAGTIDGTVSCTYYLGAVGFDTGVSTFTATGSAGARNIGYGTAFFNAYPANQDNSGTTAICTISSMTTLAFFEVREFGITNSP